MTLLYPVLFLPLITAVINRLLAGRISKGLAAGMACASVAIAFVFAALSFLALSRLAPEQRSIVTPVFEWMRVGTETFGFNLLLDPLSGVMICMVTFVGFLIHVYSSAYMHDDSDYDFGRFFAYLNFFVFSMLTLVLAANFIVLFMGWELVGVSSTC